MFRCRDLVWRSCRLPKPGPGPLRPERDEAAKNRNFNSMTTHILIRPRIAVALLALITIATACEKAAPPPPPPPDVEVIPVEQKDVPIYQEWVGTLYADVNATISAQVSGYLLRQDYKEGQLIKTGDLLFEMDPRPFQAALDQVMAKVTKTDQDVQRYTPLAAKQAISQQELDDAIQANIAAKAAAEEARLNLGFTKITSPIDGIAGLAQAQVGDLLSPASGTLTTVTRTDPIKVYFAVDQTTMIAFQERMLAQGVTLRSGSEANNGPVLQLILASGAVYPEKGKIKFANNQLDVTTGTIRVVGEFTNSQRLLVPGMFTRVRALMDIQTNVMVVPQRAITDMQGRSLIAIVGQDNKITIRPVTAGARYESWWVISGDVKPGDRVVAEGIQKVREGVMVNPVPYNAAMASAAPPSGGQTP